MKRKQIWAVALITFTLFLGAQCTHLHATEKVTYLPFLTADSNRSGPEAFNLLYNMDRKLLKSGYFWTVTEAETGLTREQMKMAIDEGSFIVEPCGDLVLQTAGLVPGTLAFAWHRFVKPEELVLKIFLRTKEGKIIKIPILLTRCGNPLKPKPIGDVAVTEPQRRPCGYMQTGPAQTIVTGNESYVRIGIITTDNGSQDILTTYPIQGLTDNDWKNFEEEDNEQ